MVRQLFGCACNTGTSGGESKLIPTTEGELGRRFQLVKLQMSVMRQAVPNYGNGIAMYLMFIKSEEKTPGGLTARALSTSMIKSPYFDYNRHQNDHTSPTATILCPDSYQSMYSQMLCGLCQNQQVLYVGSFFAITFIRAIRFLEKHWSLLCKDIRTGTVDNTMYIASECSFGINLNPFCKPSEVTYTLIRTMAYFEFLPNQVSDGVINSISMPKSLTKKEQQQLVDLADVKIGQEYELVVTTYSGLYRYRVSDVLRVAGYKNNAPQFNFLCRENVVLSIDDDKTNEVELQNAVKNAAGNLFPFDAHVTEYTSYVDIATIPSHYVLFWELRVNGSNPIPPSVFEDCCVTIEESLNSFYCKGRASDKSIGPLENRVVEIGTFDKLMDYCISLGASMNQYKTPLCVKFAPLVDLLNSRVVSSYFSPMCPKWVPRYKNGTTQTEI
ncbi:hypothetical protein KY290_006197 [Solanum tuberosum]|uniref:Indole-3-acetic acid-amido synthetase GH3.6 n=1 Tax=Solanum tuberosum TaxID=4113 RepID=A0ABQ7WGC2_SOLTU|nr:hypothetical protein KY284_006304 [Solanum tuberosum]KAH0779770.1 hypothetical protein KY290_006197 [Solanum tuberosum]